ncbi:ABC transporter ATP-binding protein [Candidatus Woesearchaeota archaeon CG_4_10_14_0_8_um_filter_47_5]|nr:MAG: ABC transporter ATP-binding protein [Candidatus Woesearchaeota archaeon CG_4_10_14_0_8_um_filter_47_5]
MKTPLYGYRKKVPYPFEEAVLRTKEALKKQSFGVLCEINVAQTLKEKLNVEMDPYIILGVCNPPFAYRALQAEKEIGLLLPCNVVIYKQGSIVIVSTVRPEKVLSSTGNPPLSALAEAVEKKLMQAIDAL